jgi:hypothetical protein
VDSKGEWVTFSFTLITEEAAEISAASSVIRVSLNCGSPITFEVVSAVASEIGPDFSPGMKSSPKWALAPGTCFFSINTVPAKGEPVPWAKALMITGPECPG